MFPNIRKPFIFVWLICGLMLIHTDGLGQKKPQSPKSSQRISRPVPKRAQAARREQLARRYERSGRYEEALRIYRGLYEGKPDHTSYFEGINRNLLSLKRYQEALDLVRERIIETKESTPRTRVVLRAMEGEIFYKMGSEKEAYAIWEEMASGFGKDQNLYRTLVGVLLRNRLFDRAVAVYEQARSATGKEHDFAYELAEIHRLRMNFEGATKEYLNHLSENPKAFSTVERNILNFPDTPGVIESVTLVLEERCETDPAVRRLLAGFAFKNRDYQRAFDEYRKLDVMEHTRGLSLFKCAQSLLKEGEFALAKEAFQYLLQNYPDSPNFSKVVLGLGEALEGLADFSGAILQYQGLTESSPRSPETAEGWIRIGDIRFEQFFELKGAEEAFGQATQVLRSGPQRTRALLRLGDCRVAQGDLKGAEEKYKQVLAQRVKRDRTQVSIARFKLAEVCYLREDFEEAKKSLEKLSAENMNGDMTNDALNLLFFIREFQSEGGLKDFARGELLVRARRYEEAIGLFHQIAQGSSPLRESALLRLGEVYALNGQFGNAIESYRGELAAFPEGRFSEEAQLAIALIYEQGLKDTLSACREYERLLIEYPRSLYAERARTRLRELEAMIIPIKKPEP